MKKMVVFVAGYMLASGCCHGQGPSSKTPSPQSGDIIVACGKLQNLKGYRITHHPNEDTLGANHIAGTEFVGGGRALQNHHGKWVEIRGIWREGKKYSREDLNKWKKEHPGVQQTGPRDSINTITVLDMKEVGKDSPQYGTTSYTVVRQRQEQRDNKTIGQRP